MKFTPQEKAFIHELLIDIPYNCETSSGSENNFANKIFDRRPFSYVLEKPDVKAPLGMHFWQPMSHKPQAQYPKGLYQFVIFSVGPQNTLKIFIQKSSHYLVAGRFGQVKAAGEILFKKDRSGEIEYYNFSSGGYHPMGSPYRRRALIFSERLAAWLTGLPLKKWQSWSVTDEQSVGRMMQAFTYHHLRQMDNNENSVRLQVMMHELGNRVFKPEPHLSPRLPRFPQDLIAHRLRQAQLDPISIKSPDTVHQLLSDPRSSCDNALPALVAHYHSESKAASAPGSYPGSPGACKRKIAILGPAETQALTPQFGLRRLKQLAKQESEPVHCQPSDALDAILFKSKPAELEPKTPNTTPITRFRALHAF